MDVLFIGLFNAHEPQQCMRDGLKDLATKNGGQYDEINWVEIRDRSGIAEMRDSLIRQVSELSPDLLFMQIQYPDVIDEETAKAFAHHSGYVVNFTGDVRHPFPLWYIEIGRHLDLTLFTNDHDADFACSQGINAKFLQVGYEHTIYNPEGEKNTNGAEIVFMGNNYADKFPLSGFRKDMVEGLYQRYGNNFRVYGGNWSRVNSENLMFQQEKEAATYRNCKIAINLSHFNYGRYSSDRLFRILGCGAFCLSHRYLHIEKDFTENTHLRTWETFSELYDLIDHYLDDNASAERQEMARAGNLLVEKVGTWSARYDQMMEIINHIPYKIK